MKFVRGTGVSRGSCSRVSDLFYLCRIRVAGGSRDEI
jgi:hypothetical protein